MALPPVETTAEDTAILKEPLENENFKKTVSWNDFTQNTTFHGIRYIFQDSPLKLRRPIWLTVVITSILVFIIQVGMRMGDYFLYKTTVDVEIIYVDSLEFPAITICNQNRFRITTAVDEGLYQVIDTIFKTSNLSRIEWDTFPEKINGIDFENFTLATAHQREFLIDSCTWNGADCDITEAFTTVITDLGVCYTFNAGVANKGRQTTEAGVGSGLTLVINVEQYEYMRGPENDAGVKILLHPRHELPLMREQGFAAAPGTHTLVGMKRYEVKSMKAPFGTCQEKNLPVSHCLEACRARQVILRCGCRAVFMRSRPRRDNGTSVCDFRMSLSCIRQTYMNLRTSTLDCECSPPCLQTKYKPQLSYAQLSKFNIDRMILDNREKKETLTEAYHKALETTQRYKQDIVEKDRVDMTRLLDLAHALRKSLDGHALVLNNATVAAQTYNLPPIFQDDFFRKDIKKIYRLISEAFRSAYNVYPYAAYRLEFIVRETKEQFLGMEGSDSKLEEKLAVCETLRDEFMQNDQGDGSGEVDVEQDRNVSLAYGSKECKESLEEFTKFISIYNSSMSYTKMDLEQLNTDTYTEMIDKVFNNTRRSPDDFEQHSICLSALTNSDILADEVAKLIKYVNLTLRAENLDQFANGSKEIRDIVLGDTLESGTKNLSSCMWVITHVHENTGDFYSVDSIVTQIHASLLASFMELSTTLVFMAHGYEERVEPIFHNLAAYLGNSKSKGELAIEMSSPLTLKLIGDIDSFENEAYRTIKDVQSKLSQLFFKLIPMYTGIIKSTFPILNVDQANDLNIIKHTAAINQSHFNEVIGGAEEEFEMNFERMMNMIQSEYDQRFEEIIDDIVKPLASLNKHLADLRQDLADFAKQSQLSVNFFLENFLQVDIFYNDMSYEEIEQQEAFKFLSLVGEVGGFMGLLLGASVMTVCELLDYVLVNMIRSCARRRKVDPNVVQVKSAWDPV